MTTAISSLVISKALTTCCAIPSGLNSWKDKSNANKSLLQWTNQLTHSNNYETLPCFVACHHHYMQLLSV